MLSYKLDAFLTYSLHTLSQSVTPPAVLPTIIDYQYNDVYNSMHFQERCFDSSLFSFRFIVGSESLEGQLVNSQTHEIAIYLRTYLHASFHRSSLFVHSKQTGCIAANKFIWTVMILNGSKVSGSLTSGRAHNWAAYKIFLRLKGGFKQTPSNPPGYRPA